MDKINKNSLREFFMTTIAVGNGTSVILLAIMILFFGVGAYNNMPKEQYPEISMPQVYINTPYFGNSAVDIENLITRPIEKEIQTIDGIKDISSTSLQDYSVVIAEFNSDVKIEDAVRKVKDAVDLAKNDLPTDLDAEPLVDDINFSEFPIFTVNLSGEYSNDELRHFAEYLQDEIEDVREISRVDIKGALEREIKVDLDPFKMASTEVNFTDVQNAIASENITMSGGEIVSDQFRRALRVVGEFKNAEELSELIIKSEYSNPVYLRDIADVKFSFKDQTSIARSDLLPVISLDVIKRGGTNLLKASDEIKGIIAKAQKEILPEGLKVSLFNDQSVNTLDGVSNLLNSIISGIILVVLVLLFFLGFRNALFVGAAIPLSMLLGITIMSIFGITINVVVLFSLILALGLLVDNGIVVVENIYRYISEGYSPSDAAKFGTGEVAVPIIISTATTLAAFIPLAFWPGLMGEFMKFMPFTLIIVLSSSLFVALVINPVLTSKFMKIDRPIEDSTEFKARARRILLLAFGMIVIAALAHLINIMAIRNFAVFAMLFTLINFFILRPASFGFQNKVLPLLELGYSKFVNFALRWPVTIFISTVALLIISVMLLMIKAPKIEYFPVADPIYVNAFIELPQGSDIDATNEVMFNLEKKIIDKIKGYGPVVEAVLSQIGEDTADPQRPPEPGASPNRGRITVSFIPSKERGDVSTFDIMDDIREAVKGQIGVQISVDKNAEGPPTGKAINIELSGADIDKLSVLSDDVIKYLNNQNVPGVEELASDVKLGKPELIINVDREAARRYQVSTFAIADAIRTSVYGKEVSKYKVGEDEFPIFVRLKKENRNSVSDLLNQKITFRDMTNGSIVQIPISAIADVEYASTYSSIKRKNLDRAITVYSNVLEGYNSNEVVAEIKEAMEDYNMPQGYNYDFSGEQEQQAEDMGFLGRAFLVALFSIFIIIVAQFNSIVSPFIIILSVVFSVIGVLLGYVGTGRDIVVIMTGVGVISLAGVVVNNAIVLLDYVNLLIRRKVESNGMNKMSDLSYEDIKDCIIQAGATRLRPVLLTAITTVLGLIPLAVGININFFTIISDLDPQFFLGGDNASFWGPMAWTVIYGLVFATFLTLVVVPVMFWLAYRIVNGVNNIFNRI